MRTDRENPLMTSAKTVTDEIIKIKEKIDQCNNLIYLGGKQQ